MLQGSKIYVILYLSKLLVYCKMRKHLRVMNYGSYLELSFGVEFLHFICDVG